MKGRSVLVLPLAAALAVIIVSGCYSYREVPRERIAPGSTVRLRIAAEEAVRQQQVFGELRETLEGRLVEPTSPGALSLVLRLRPHGPAERGYSTVVNVPEAAITRVEAKRFSPARTALFAGAGTAAAVAALAIHASATSDGPEPPPVQEMRIPLFRWTLHR